MMVVGCTFLRVVAIEWCIIHQLESMYELMEHRI